MELLLTFYGQITEISLVNEIVIHLPKGSTIFELKKSLLYKYPKLEAIDLKFAINNKIINQSIELNQSDNISIFPPFSGG